ncbi:MAG: c-type cytochrome [Gemmatimonadota bacterium]
MAVEARPAQHGFHVLRGLDLGTNRRIGPPHRNELDADRHRRHAGEPENLEVLPDDIGADGLRSVMLGFTEALDVGCEHCHVGEGDLENFDFPADDKEPKRIARIMLRMVDEINGTHLVRVETVRAGDRVEVTCITCHRGATLPRRIEDVLASMVEEEGVEAAIARYRELRDELYGGFTYDFRPGPLAELGRRLADRGRPDDAIQIIGLEAEYHPDSYTTWFALAQVQDGVGRRTEAIGSMERALELAPERARGFLQRQLDRLRGG